MKYELVFPTERVEKEFEKELRKLSKNYQERIVASVRSLADIPRPPGKKYKKLEDESMVFSFVAQYRLRIGKYRVLYDIDDKNRRVILLKLAKRQEHTYK
ncbi:MAG TPA: type II toxin-antitoxin system RelE/ParE family toxin [Thermodesulfobacteriota bacterium]